MKTNFFSNGKLLLTSEYVVLDGALALAVPTKLGQEFSVEEDEIGDNKIFWNAYHQGKSWLFAEIDFCSWEIGETNLPENAEFIRKTLQNIQKMNKEVFVKGKDYHISTNLQFPSNFGLGSSSTLMTNLAKWAQVDAFLLNEISLGGSGYDIAVAMEQSSILYQLKDNQRFINKVDFSPSFKNELIFLHLNQKQDSREGINLYRGKERSQGLIERFSELTREILEVKNLSDFSEIMIEHERLLSDFLGLKTIKEKEFQDCPSFIKSLGAWGGDFVMASKFDGYREYFSQKGFSTILDYEEMILTI